MNLSKTTVVRGIVAVGFAGAATLGTIVPAQAAQGSAQQYCANLAVKNAGSDTSSPVYQNWYQKCSENPSAYGYSESSTSQTQSTQQEDPNTVGKSNQYRLDCIGPTDVDPNWQPKSWCPNQQKSQSVPTYVPAGGQAPANYDATNNRSADTLVLP